MTFTKLVKALLSFLLHLVALGVVGGAFWPIASWYLNHRPVLGIDFYNTVTFAKYFQNNFELLPRNYLDFWYGGSPIEGYLIISWFKTYAFVAGFLPILKAIKITSLASFGILTFFVYMGAFRLSKNHFLSVLISLLVIFSPNMYGSLTWGGSLPYFANQLFLPAVLWLVASYLDTGKKGWYWITILVLGIATYGHIGNAGAFMLPMVIMLLLFGQRHVPSTYWAKAKETGVFLFVYALYIYKYLSWFRGVSFGTLTTVFNATGFSKPETTVQAGTPGIQSETGQAVAAYTRGLFTTLFTDTEGFFYVLLGLAFLLFAAALVLGRERRRVLGIIPWVMIVGYGIFHVYINSLGISFLAQGWYRAFWHFPIVLGFLIASFYGFVYSAFTARNKILGIAIYVMVATSGIVMSFWRFYDGAQQQTIDKIEAESSISSAHPQILELLKNENELDKLKIYPSWMDVKDKNYRLYTSDAQVNVWWNALYDLPLVRGYLDPPGNISQHFLLDQAVGGDGLVKNYKYPEDVAKNMALYYIDWYAIRFAEGGHLSQSPNNPPSNYLKDVISDEEEVVTPGAYMLYQTQSGKPEIYEDAMQYLYFYRFAEDIISPIVTVSDAPALLCICDYPAYESLIKVFSMHNLNSRNVVSVYWPETIDKLQKKDIDAFDVVVMSNYRYQNRRLAFDLFKDYLKSGGKLFIDTGGETKDSQSQFLPEWLPFKQTKRQGLGKEWQFSKNSANEIIKNFDLASFSPPIFDGSEWNLSYPVGKIDGQADVLLSHQDKPILILWDYAGGKVVWSGLNLGYHIQYYTDIEESNLYIDILRSLIPLSPKTYSLARTEFVNAGNLKIHSDVTGKGVLIKRQMYDNWRLTLNGKQVQGYAAGPSHPGFIYIPYSSGKSIDLNVTFLGDSRGYKEKSLSFLIALLLVDRSLFGGRLLGKRLTTLKQILRKRTRGWWEKEE